MRWVKRPEARNFYAEIAGGMGLVIPAATRIAPWLTPLAGLRLATIMILAIPFHVLKGEASVIWIHALIAALADSPCSASGDAARQVVNAVG